MSFGLGISTDWFKRVLFDFFLTSLSADWLAGKKKTKQKHMSIN